MNQGVEGGNLIQEVCGTLKLILSKGKMYPTPLPSGNLSDSNHGTADNNGRSTRLYQVWQGRNTFFLGGRLVFGPDVKSLFLTLMLILAPMILFCAFVSRELFDAFPHRLGCLILVVCILWTTYVVVLLILTSGRDPGIIPRQPHPPDDYDGSTISTDWPSIQSGALSIPQTKDVVVNHKSFKVKYCRTCMFYRPPRCSHCSICNNCIERFDHHCPWVGQCIGRRNYRYFFMFVLSSTLLCLYVFAFCWVNIVLIAKTNHCNIWRATLKSPISGVLIAYTFFVAWFVGGLTTFHIYLMCTNQTTYENFRYHYDRKTNPYNIGCANNVWEAIFSKIPNSKLNFRAHVIFDSYSISNGSSYSNQSIPPDRQNTSFDLDVGKRQDVSSDDIEDTRRTHRASGRLDRRETRSRNDSWDRQSDEWEIPSGKNSEVTSDVTSDIHILPTESEHNVYNK